MPYHCLLQQIYRVGGPLPTLYDAHSPITLLVLHLQVTPVLGDSSA
jgi:hypothetical protein